MVLEKYFDYMLAFHCAPTLAGLKVANLISLKKKKFVDFKAMLKGYESCLNCKDIYVEIMMEGSTHVLLYIYRKSKLEFALSEPKNKELLLQMGYGESKSINACLEKLKQKINLQKSFPHEIGIFLGYPADDVVGFINHRGQKFKLSGYWKVYTNIEQAQKTFEKYTRCSNIFCQRLNQEGSIKNLVMAM